MTKFHINGEGNPGKCSAASGNCPFGGEANHYSTEANARKAFELSMAASAVPQKKTRKSSEVIAKDATDARKAREFANLFTLHNHNTKANEDDSERLDPTYEKLQELAAAKPVGTMFERADRLKKSYKKFASADGSGNFAQAEDMSYWSYLQVVAPATAHVNYAMTNAFEEEGWTTGNGSTEHYEANAKAFKKILELDLRKKDSAERAADFLREADWDVSETDSEEWGEGVQATIQKAMTSGKKVAESYGGQYRYEGAHLL